LSWDEVRRVYEIGVEVCKGKVPVYANMPEVRSAQEAIDFSNLAIESGVDIVNLYGPAALHGYRPNDAELTTYFDDVLSAINHPVTLAPNPVQGYTPKRRSSPTCATATTRLSRNAETASTATAYFIVSRMDQSRGGMNVPLSGSLHTLGLGRPAYPAIRPT